MPDFSKSRRKTRATALASLDKVEESEAVESTSERTFSKPKRNSQ